MRPRGHKGRDPRFNQAPLGAFQANSQRQQTCVAASNIGRGGLATAAGQWARATVKTLREKLIAMPARLVHTGRRLLLRAPTDGPWADAYRTATARIAAIPAPTWA